MEIKAYIIDDEAPARRELKFLLEQVGGIEIVGEAQSGTAGLKGIKETKPHVVFLDVQMPGISGLELSQFLCEMPDRPLLVFATAFEEYAVDAFEVEAFDYILKPFTLERVKKTVLKILKCFKEEICLSEDIPDLPKDAASGKEVHDVTKKIPLFKGDRIIPTPPDKILFARCLEGEIHIQTADGKYKAKSSLSDLEQKLAPYGFIRTHRSFLVNTNHVMEVIPWFSGCFKLIMNDKEKTEVLVSRHNKKDLKKYFDI